MKNLTLLIVSLFLFSGCGLFKKVTSSSEKDKFHSETSIQKQTDSTVIKTDKTVIVETEKADTTKNAPAITIENSKPADLTSIVNGMKVVDSGLVTVFVQLDTLSGKITTKVHVKEQPVHFQVDKKKETFTDKKEDTKKASSEKQEAIVDTKHKAADRKEEPAKMGILAIVALIGACVLAAGALIYFKFIRKT